MGAACLLAFPVGSASADDSANPVLLVTVKPTIGASPQATSISVNEANENVDISKENITVYEPPPYQPNPETLSGTSIARVAELAGAAPSSVSSAIISNPEIPLQTYTVTGAEITGGFPGDPNAYDASPCFALFVIRAESGDPDGWDFYRPMAGPGDNNSPVVGSDGGDLDVTVNVTGAILDVGTPTVSPTTTTAGVSVQFTASASVIKDGASDTGPFTYSWDFGDGSNPGSGASTTHSYSAGTWDARVTVTDANGNQGISSQVPITVNAKGTTITTNTTPANTTPTNTTPTTPAGGGGGGGGGGGSPTGTGKSPAAPAGKSPTGRGTGPKKAQSSGALRSAPAVVTGAGTGSGHSGSGSGAAGHGPAGYAGGVHGGSGRRTKGGTVGGAIPTGRGKVGYLLTASRVVPLTVNKSLLVHAVARASGGSGGSVVPLGWILGVLALLIVFSSGALRALEPRAQYRKLAPS
jgi:hypothetical protein